jgi:hypothetical protein
MRNLFEDAIYLFDMEIEQPTIITSQADSNFELHVIPDYEYTCNDGFHIKPIGIALFIYFIKDGELEERDVMDGSHYNSKYFFDYLKWFHEAPQQMLNDFYRSELEIINHKN